MSLGYVGITIGMVETKAFFYFAKAEVIHVMHDAALSCPLYNFTRSGNHLDLVLNTVQNKKTLLTFEYFQVENS